MRGPHHGGGAENPELLIEIDCDLDDAALNQFLLDAAFASPLNGLMRGRVKSLFKLSKNGAPLTTDRALELDGPHLPDPDAGFEAASPVDPGFALLERSGRRRRKKSPTAPRRRPHRSVITRADG